MIFSIFNISLVKIRQRKECLLLKMADLQYCYISQKNLSCQVFENVWKYICGSSQNVRKLLNISAESVKYIGGVVYFLLNLTAFDLTLTLISHTLTKSKSTKSKVFFRCFLRFFNIAEQPFLKHLFSYRIHLDGIDCLSCHCT